MEIYGYDQNNGCLNSFFLIILSTFGAFYKITEIKLIKAYFSHTCCPKNERSSWSAFSECLIKMLGLLMLSILGAFFKNWYTKLIKGILTIQGVRKNENGLVRKWIYMDIIKIWVLLKSFYFVMLSILRAFFQIWINQKLKMDLFWWKNEYIWTWSKYWVTWKVLSLWCWTF